MDKEIKIILGLIVVLVGVVLGLVLVSGKNENSTNVVTEDEWEETSYADEQFTNSSSWITYTSEEYAYEIRYPFTWEFNLMDGTTFHPELCARNKYDKCVSRISIGVYPEIDDNNTSVDLQKKCTNVDQIRLRYVSSDVWMCEEIMSDEFASAQGYNRKRAYHFKDNRGSIFEIDIMYTKGESIKIEEEMIQTIKLKAK